MLSLNIMETLDHLMLWSLVIVISGSVVWIFRRQRLPDLPILKISQRPGRLGIRDDLDMFINNQPEFQDIGYERYSKKGQHYLVRTPVGYEVMVAPKFLEEIRRAPETHVNNLEANIDIMQMTHTLHPFVAYDQYHMNIPIRKNLTQALNPRLPDIVEEAKLCLDEYVGLEDGWFSRELVSISFSTITRTANRLLFGLELARHAEFMDLSIKNTVTMFGGANLIRYWPELIKPVIMWWKTNIGKEQALGRKILGPIIEKRWAEEERYRHENRMDEWRKVKAEDAMQWIFDVTPPKKRRLDHMVLRLLNLSIAAIHTSSAGFLDTMLMLAFTPEYHSEIREEIERVFTEEGGWTKQGVSHLVKVDSYMTEVARITSGLNSVRMKRKIIRDWRMSDGTLLPKGTTLSMNIFSRLRSSELFPEPLTFDPWRMYRKRQEEGKANQYQFVMTSEYNLNFGHGNHACPGRFFAANEIKIMVALFIMRYEIKAPELKGGLDAVIRGIWYGEDRSPLQKAPIELKDRRPAIPDHLKELF